MGTYEMTIVRATVPEKDYSLRRRTGARETKRERERERNCTASGGTSVLVVVVAR